MPEVDFNNRIELWLCDECMQAEVNDDYTGLDYTYGTAKSNQRMREIQAGLHSLSKQGQLCNDSHDPDEPQRECRDCGHIGKSDDFEYAEETEDQDETYFCPECASGDTDARDSGQDEFSWSDCDCCGTTLGGSRSRYALFPYLKED